MRASNFHHRKRTGLTLVEVLVALALLGLVIGLVADVASRYSKVLLFSQEKDKASQAITAIQELVAEVEQCAKVLAPTGTGESVLRLVKVKADSPLRNDDLENWRPYRPSDQETVEYLLSGTDILRSQPSVETTILLNDANGFATSLQTNRSIKIEISVKKGEEVKTFTGLGFVWADPVDVEEAEDS